jgi:hypothetical protein
MFPMEILNNMSFSRKTGYAGSGWGQGLMRCFLREMPMVMAGMCFGP